MMKIKLKNFKNVNILLRTTFYIAVFSLIGIIINSCAVIESPSGGPRDTIPPQILIATPQWGTLNFNNRTATLVFSKYMDKAKVIENLTISPKTDLKFSWSGKELEIEFAKELDTNTTYSLQLGTDYSDYYQVKPSQAFELIFSTGNKLDSGTISGKLIDERPAGAYIFIYNITAKNPDTLNPRNVAPDYKVQIGTSGEFKLGAIKDGNYRAFVIKDEFKNDLYDDIDAFGATENDITVKDAKSTPFVIKLGTPIDETAPELISAESIYSNQVLAQFSEFLDSNYVRTESFYLIDSINSEPLTIKGINFGSSQRDIVIHTEQLMDSTKSYILTAFKNSEFSIRDTSGNLLSDSSNIAFFKGYSRLDSTQPLIKFYPFADSTLNIAQNKYIRFVFLTPVDTNSFRNALDFHKLDDKSKINYRIQPFLNNVIRIEPSNLLEPETWYEIILKSKLIKGLNGISAQDTTIKLRFKTSDMRTLGNANGVIKGVDFCKENLIITITNISSKLKYNTKTDELGKWDFKNIEPGEYSIDVFCDLDKNGKYSYGKAFPYGFSEPFFIIESKLNIRSRWNIEDFIINITDSEK